MSVQNLPTLKKMTTYSQLKYIVKSSKSIELISKGAYGVIYKITNTINGKIYIGKDSSNKKNYYGSGKAIKNSIKKYGKENFTKEIIDYAESLDELNNKEKYWIKFYNSTNSLIGYNRSSGGDGDFIFSNMTNEAKERMKESLRKCWKSKEFSERKKEDTINYFKEPNNRKKQSDTLKKVWANKTDIEKKEIVERLKDGSLKRWEKIEEKEKASKLWKEKNPMYDSDLRKKMSKDRKGSKNPYSKKCSVDDIVYESISEAMSSLGLTRNQIAYRIRSKNYLTYKYI